MNSHQSRPKRAALIAVVALAGFAMTGCTLIGLGIGAQVDRDKHDVTVSGWQFEEIEQGTKLDLILKNGTTVSGTYVDRGAPTPPDPAASPVPSRSSIRLLVSGQKVAYATDEVAMVQIRARKNGKPVGAAIGLIIDAALVISAMNSLGNTQFKCRTSDCSGSCPFVYSYDGHGYNLEGEMFGGAIFKASQRSDRVRFERLADHNGEYRIRLANHNQEVQEVDHAQLLVVDHPQGTEVLPTLTAEFLTFAQRVPPLQARSMGGADLVSMVRADDGASWISTPLGRNSEDPGQLRDGLVLEFPRPPAAETVKLAFTVRSTSWSAGLLNHIMGLQGRDIDAWRDRMNTRSDERVAFLAALRREGLLRLSVWDGAGWRDSGVLANVGPGAPRRQAVRLNLRGIEGSTLRIRLDSTPGMWMVDAAAADYSPDIAFKVRALRPIRAVSHDGRDLRAALAADDGSYYTMPTTSDSADLAFEALPPVAPGQRRSFMFEASGYYSILVPATEPRRAVFDQLVSTPGAFARYSLGLAEEDLALARTRLAAARIGSMTPRAWGR